MTVHPRFVHLRVRSKYSILESAVDLKTLPELCLKHEMPAVGVVDSSNMFGALEFSTRAAEKGVQPIHGCQVSLPFAESSPGQRLPNAPIVLLAQDKCGYNNLLKLNSILHLSKGRRVPFVTIQELKEFGDGLICLTGGSDGVIGQLLLDERDEEAEEMARSLASIFQNRTYIEIQRHRHPGTTCAHNEEITEARLVDIAYRLGIPLVATNDVQFAEPGLYEAVDLLFYIKNGGFATQKDPRRKLTSEHWFKSQEAMVELFADLPEATANTLEIAKRCAFHAESHKPMLPRFCEDEDAELKERALEGLHQRFTAIELADSEQVYLKRLDHELGVIQQIGFAGYFLIVRDFVVWAKEHGIPVGPGRGSGAGSLVAYALRITNLDPIRYSLLFERFLNPERNSIPDFDIDFCQNRRDEVIEYVRSRYGQERVAQIITFGTLGAKGAIRDFGRVLRVPRRLLDRLSAAVDPRYPLAEQRKDNGRLAEFENSEPSVGELFDYIVQIEGLPRNPSRHAAGIVIGNQPLNQVVPLYNDSDDALPVTQFDMKWVEAAGLVKMDFLGLRTLTVISMAVEMLREKGVEIDIDGIDLEDAEVFELYSSGHTTGVFQVEGAGMIEALRQMKPNCIEDIIALVALYRPGPMENIPEYCRVKHGGKRKLLHKLIDHLLDETNGIIVYQEQVTEIARQMGGYTLGRADLLRHAMGKKLPEDMAREKPVFLAGAKEKGVGEEVAIGVWNLLERFASYGFNKSHAAVYAVVSYQTAWLKAKHPQEFMAAVMSLDIHDTDKLASYVSELARMKLKLVPPCVNRSREDFRVRDESIIYALSAIKGVGGEAARIIVAERGDRPFEDMFDFARRVRLQSLTKSTIENLARAGAFDCLEPNRRGLLKNIEKFVSYSKDNFDGGGMRRASLFDDGIATIGQPSIHLGPSWGESEQLSEEQTALGFYLSSHPLDKYEDVMAAEGIRPLSDVIGILDAGPDSLGDKVELRTAGILTKVNRRVSKSNKPMAILTLAARSGEVTAFMFPQDYETGNGDLKAGQPVIAFMNLEKYQGRVSARISLVRSLDRLKPRKSRIVRIHFDQPDLPRKVKTLLETQTRNIEDANPARIVFCPYIPGNQHDIELTAPRPYWLNNSVKQAIESFEGVKQVNVSE